MLVVTTASVREVPLPLLPAPPHLPKALAVLPAPQKAVEPSPEVAAVPARLDEPLLTVDDLDRPSPGWRSAAVIEPTRPWVLPDKTWRAIAESRWNVDVSLEPGHEYIGVRIVLPFGS